MNPIKSIRTGLRDVRDIETRVTSVERALDRMRLAQGRIEARMTRNAASLREAEFHVFSQFGEDGIIQYLIERLHVASKRFIEFGVENYTEANTRFLLENNGWSGLILDSSRDHIKHIRGQEYYWKHELTAVEAMIDRDNVNAFFREHGFEGEIGLLSIDIDGNDYWVWEAIDSVDPALVVVEYNHRFGPERAVTIPYSPDFQRAEAHHSMIYYGASLNALCRLGRRKGYAFLGCNSAGNNAWFVKRGLKPEDLPEQSAEDGFVQGRFREARDESGRLAFLSLEEEQEILDSLPLESVE